MDDHHIPIPINEYLGEAATVPAVRVVLALVVKRMDVPSPDVPAVPWPVL